MPQNAPPPTFQDALTAFKAQRYPRAIAIAEALYRADRQNIKLVFFLGQAYAAAGNPERAKAAFGALAKHPDAKVHGPARQWLSRLVSAAPEPPPVAAQPDAPPAAPEPPPAPRPAPRPPTAPLRVSEASRCGACGVPLPAERLQDPWCWCGWNLQPAKGAVRLWVAPLLRFTSGTGAKVALAYRGDRYVFDRGLAIETPGGKRLPVDPRAVFPTERGLPFIPKPHLSPVAPSSGPEPFALDGERKRWDELLDAMWQALPPAAKRPDGSLRALLRDLAQWPDDTLPLPPGAEAEGSPTLGAAILEGDYPFQDLYEAAVGPIRALRPRHRGAAHPLFTLVQRGLLPEAGFAEALTRQLKDPKTPLEVVLEGLGVKPGALKAADGARAQLADQVPDRDTLSEVLIRMGRLSRTELAQAKKEAKGKQQSLEAALLGKGTVDADALTEAKLRLTYKRQLRLEGAVRLGTVLLAQRAVEPEALKQALLAQIHDPRPVGEILIAQGACAPEQVIYGLIEQEAQLEALIEQHFNPEPEAAPEEAPERSRTAPLMALTGALSQHLGARKQAGRRKAYAMTNRRLSPLLRLALIAVGVTGLGLGALALWANAPQLPGSAILKGPENARMVGGRRVVDVDIDSVIAKLESGDPNPLDVPGTLSRSVAPDSLAGAAQDLDAPEAPRGKPKVDRFAIAERAKREAVGKAASSAESAMALGKHAQAARLFEQALKGGNRNADLYVQLAKAKRLAGDGPGAFAPAAAAAALAPELASAWLEQGEAELARGNAKAALADFEQARAHGGGARADLGLGRARLALKQPKEARVAFQAAAKAHPDDAEAHLALAASLGPESRQEALAAWLRGADLARAAADANRHDAEGRREAKAHEPEVQALRLAIEGYVRQGEALQAASRLALALKDREAAGRHLQRARAALDEAALGQVALGQAFEALADAPAATQAYFVAARFSPRFPEPYEKLAAQAKQQERPEEAARFEKLAEARR